MLNPQANKRPHPLGPGNPHGANREPRRTDVRDNGRTVPPWEAIAAGIWFESDDTMLGDRDLDTAHPFRGLANIEATERFESSGIVCVVRRNPLPLDEIERFARLCSQVIVEVGAELDGRSSTDWCLTRRIRNGIGESFLRGYFGNSVAKYDGIPSMSEIRPSIDQWLAEVGERRRQIGTK